MLLNTINCSVGLMFASAQATKKKSKVITAGNGNTAGVTSQSNYCSSIRKFNSLSLITGKLNTGKKLSAAEKRYLRDNDPEMYRRSEMLEKERKLYRRRLEKARTKDEVRKLNMSASVHMVTEAGAACHGGNGGNGGTSAGSLELSSMRSSIIRDEHGAFVNSREYRKLPENVRELIRAKRKPVKAGSSKASALPPIRSAAAISGTVVLSGAGGVYRKRGVSYLV